LHNCFPSLPRDVEGKVCCDIHQVNDNYYSATVPDEIAGDFALRILSGFRLRSRKRRHGGQITSSSGTQRTIRTMVAAITSITMRSINISSLRDHLD
jgi:hypothetical protein